MSGGARFVAPPLVSDRATGKTARRRAGTLAQFQRAFPAYVFILPSIVLLAVFMYYPAFSALYHSFFNWDGFTRATFAGLGNFAAMAEDATMRAAAVNVLKLTAFAVIVSITVPLFVARLIWGLPSERAQYVFRVLFVIPLVLPQVVIYLIWKYLYDPNFGLLNELLMALHVGSPQAWLGDPNNALYALMGIGFPWVDGFALLIFTAGLQSIPREILDAAAIDGAGSIERFRRIEFPLLLGQIKLIMILNMIWTIQNFTSILILTQGGPGTSTMVPGMVLYRASFQNERMGYACAIGMAMFFVMLALTYLNLRYVRSESEFAPRAGSVAGPSAVVRA
jgi:raffinose/stachyose/melibiose transport system permease protein